MTMSGEIHTKRFHWKDLLDPVDAIDARCAAIEHLTGDLALFPRTWHERTPNALIQRQEHVAGRTPLIVAPTAVLGPLEQLARKLDVMSGHGFVHGDISVLNTIWDGKTIHLVDFEPSLRQMHRGRSMLKSPRELRAHRDVRDRTVTTRTDRVAYFLLCARLLGRSATRGANGMINAGESMTEDDLTPLSFPVLLQLVIRQPRVAGAPGIDQK